MLADFIEAAPGPDADINSVKSRFNANQPDNSYSSNNNYNVNANIMPVNSQSAAQQNNVSSKSGLYIRVDAMNSAKFNRAMSIISVFEGITKLFVYFCDKKQLTCAPTRNWVTINKPMLDELKLVLGENNVAVRE